MKQVGGMRSNTLLNDEIKRILQNGKLVTDEFIKALMILGFHPTDIISDFIDDKFIELINDLFRTKMQIINVLPKEETRDRLINIINDAEKLIRLTFERERFISYRYIKYEIDMANIIIEQNIRDDERREEARREARREEAKREEARREEARRREEEIRDEIERINVIRTLPTDDFINAWMILGFRTNINPYLTLTSDELINELVSSRMEIINLLPRGQRRDDLISIIEQAENLIRRNYIKKFNEILKKSVSISVSDYSATITPQQKFYYYIKNEIEKEIKELARREWERTVQELDRIVQDSDRRGQEIIVQELDRIGQEIREQKRREQEKREQERR